MVSTLVPLGALGQKMHLAPVDTKTAASYRGVSVVDDSTAWVGGSNGWVGATLDGGKRWSFAQVKGFEKCDFRSVYAADAKNVIIANAGSPAYILRSADGGATWSKVYENNDSAAFIDGVDFWNKKEGVVYGDPIGNRLLVLHTNDGGKSWNEYAAENRPLVADGEASFAASGTCIRCMGRKKLVIATGGKVSRLLISNNKGKSWKARPTPILQGESSTGVFTLLPYTNHHWLIAGGDYKRDTLSINNLFVTNNAGKSWISPVTTTRGYRECLEAIGDAGRSLMAVGPGGIDVSYDDGYTWQPFSDEKQFHVIRKSRAGNFTVLAGGGGKVAVLQTDRK